MKTVDEAREAVDRAIRTLLLTVHVDACQQWERDPTVDRFAKTRNCGEDGYLCDKAPKGGSK